MTAQHLPGIGRFTPRDARDATQWARLETFLHQHGAQAFSRDPHIGGHVTGSAFVLSPDGQSTLLTYHRKLNRWLQLGGHCDSMPDARATALREAQEESGIPGITLLREAVFDIDIHEIPATAREPAHLHYDIRYLMQAQTTAFTASDESHALAWVPLDQLDAYTQAPSVLRLRDRLDGQGG